MCGCAGAAAWMRLKVYIYGGERWSFIESVIYTCVLPWPRACRCRASGGCAPAPAGRLSRAGSRAPPVTIIIVHTFTLITILLYINTLYYTIRPISLAHIYSLYSDSSISNSRDAVFRVRLDRERPPYNDIHQSRARAEISIYIYKRGWMGNGPRRSLSARFDYLIDSSSTCMHGGVVGKNWNYEAF